MRWEWWEPFVGVGMVIGGLVCALVVTILVWLLLFSVGLVAAPCQMESEQPKCVKAGWGHTTRIEGKLPR